MATWTFGGAENAHWACASIHSLIVMPATGVPGGTIWLIAGLMGMSSTATETARINLLEGCVGERSDRKLILLAGLLIRFNI